MEFVLRATFEWREVANLMCGFGIAQPVLLREPTALAMGEADDEATDAGGARDPGGRQFARERLQAATIYRSSLALAHQSRPFARHLVALLGRLHQQPIRSVRASSPDALRTCLNRPLAARDVGLFWALLSDPRDDVNRLARLWKEGAAD